MGKAPTRVVTPTLIGLSVPAAHDAALDAGLLAVVQHSGGPDDAVVSAQYPLPGHRQRRGARIRVWAHRPGNSDDDSDDDGPGGGGGGGLLLPTGPGPRAPSGTKPH